MPRGNHSSWRLNEHGPALKVFWIPEHRDWAHRAGGNAALKIEYRVIKKGMTKNTEPEGAGGPLRSFRFE
jgi:hypothetical protein